MTIALTGGIASGKTSAANFFAAYGVPVIDADAIAWELTTPNSPLTPRIVDYFGPEAVRLDGTLDRRYLRKKIFFDAEKKAWLEDLLHPCILKTMVERCEQAEGPYLIAVVPLLFETKSQGLFDRSLVVYCPEVLQKQRLAQRDGCDETLIQAMLDQQFPEEARLALADDVLQNEGSLEELREAVAAQHHHYLSLSS